MDVFRIFGKFVWDSQFSCDLLDYSMRKLYYFQLISISIFLVINFHYKKTIKVAKPTKSSPHWNTLENESNKNAKTFRMKNAFFL